MGEDGRFGGGAWAQALAGLTAVVLLAGCVSAEELKKRERESEGYYKQGLSNMDSNQQQAFVSFQKSLQLNPDNYDAHYALGSIHFQRKEFAEAEREFRRCIELMPDNGEALNFYGRTLIELKRLPEAVDVLRKTTALPLYATPDKAYSSLGHALFLMGDSAGAIRAYQEALKVDPPSVPRALLYLEVGRLYIAQGENARAREALAQVKSLDPQGTAGAEATKLMQKMK
ncbi:MAG: tetratricopeptide repeat protein [Nitrospirae bacterium]|nr:tetratricopeptide repeat protein [Nitrospirota bacterium]